MIEENYNLIIADEEGALQYKIGQLPNTVAKSLINFLNEVIQSNNTINLTINDINLRISDKTFEIEDHHYVTVYKKTEIKAIKIEIKGG